MRKWKQLTCALLLVLLVLDCCPPVRAEDEELVTLFVFTSESEKGLPVRFMLKNDTVYIDGNDLAQVSGFVYERSSAFVCEDRSVSLDECRLGKSSWYAAERALELLGVRTHQVKNTLFFEAAGAARARARARADLVMVKENYRYYIQESGKIGVFFSLLYDALSGDAVAMADGRYKSSQIREVLVDMITEDEDQNLKLISDFDSAMDKLTCWSELFSSEELAELPEDLMLLSMYGDVTDPVSALFESAGAKLKGFGLSDQLKIIQYMESYAFVSDLYLNCFRYTFEGDPDAAAEARRQLPSFYPSLADEAEGLLSYYRSTDHTAILAEFIEEELDTITKKTFESGVETVVETLTGTKLAAAAAKVTRKVMDALLPAGKQMKLTLKMTILSKLQRSAYALYSAYCRKPGTEINQKYAALLYLQCCAQLSDYVSETDASIDMRGYDKVVEEAMSRLIEIPDRLLMEDSAYTQPDLLSFMQTRQSADYTGMWFLEGTGNHSISVYEQDGQSICIEVTSIKPAAGGNSDPSIDVTKIENIQVINGQGSKEYTDSFGNEGVIFLIFSGESLYVDFIVSARVGMWGIDAGTGSYLRKVSVPQTGPDAPGSPLTDGVYYARINDVELTGGDSAVLHTVLLGYDRLKDEDVAGLSAGDTFSANGETYIVESGSFESGWFSLGSYSLIRTFRGDWAVYYPSDVPVLYELGNYDFVIPKTMTMIIDPIVAMNFSAQETSGTVVDLFSRYGDSLPGYRFLLTIQNGVVTAVELPYMP